MDTRDGRIYSREAVRMMDAGQRCFLREMELPPTPRQQATGWIGRNDPCPCASGKKFKKCCLVVHQKPLTLRPAKQ